MKNIFNFFFILVLFASSVTVFVPAFAFASTPDSYSGLVKCSGVVQNNGEVECNFTTLISTVKSLINWLFVIAIPVAVALFAYAGLLYMSGKEGNKEKGKNIFLNVAIGFVIMLVSYTVVQTVIGWLVNPQSGATTFINTTTPTNTTQ